MVKATTEDYLYLSDYREGEEKDFSIIEVYPHLNYWNTYDCLDQDRKRLFEASLNPNLCCVNIHVRSQEAQKEICSYLIGKGYEAEPVQGNVLGMHVCQRKSTDIQEGDEPLESPRNRSYYNLDQKDEIEKFLMSKSNLSVSVKFKTDELIEFKKAIKNLRSKKLYRNKWSYKTNCFIIK